MTLCIPLTIFNPCWLKHASIYDNVYSIIYCHTYSHTNKSNKYYDPSDLNNSLSTQIITNNSFYDSLFLPVTVTSTFNWNHSTIRHHKHQQIVTTINTGHTALDPYQLIAITE